MASKLSSALFLASLVSAQAYSVNLVNLTGQQLDLGGLVAPAGATAFEIPAALGPVVLTVGTNEVTLGGERHFEVTLCQATGLTAVEHWAPLEAFSAGAGIGVAGLTIFLGLAVLRRLHPGHAASPEL